MIDMGIIVINSYAFGAAAVAAPTGTVIEDDDGTDNSITINSDADFGFGMSSISAGTDFDIATGSTIMFAGGATPTITIKAYGNSTGGGTVATHSWALTDTSGGSGATFGVNLNNASGSSQNYTNGEIEITSSSSGNQGRFSIAYTASNSGGSDAATAVTLTIRIV